MLAKSPAQWVRCGRPFVRVPFCTESGVESWFWRRNVARFHPDVLDCVFFLYTSEAETETESRIGATAFGVQVPIEGTDDGVAYYAVTAAHVVLPHRERAAPAHWARINHVDGGYRSYKLGPWTVAEEYGDGLRDDVGIALLNRLPLNKLKLSAISAGKGLEREAVFGEEEWYGLGDPVYMIGRLWGLPGKEQNTPVFRFGDVAMLPGEPVSNSELGIQSEAFLVEMRSQCGFSGSPVFVSPYKGAGEKLLGVDWGHITGSTQSGKGVENAGLVGVTPFWRVRELLMREDVVEERRKLGERLPGEEPLFVADSAPDDATVEPKSQDGSDANTGL